MDVLLCMTSTQSDPCIDRVAAALADRGAGLIRLDTARFPADLRISLDPAGGFRLRDAAGEVDLSRVGAAWIRHMDVGAVSGQGIAPEFRDGAIQQSQIALWGGLEVLPVRFVDRPSRLNSVAEHARQLQLAAAAGLAIPRTLVTNDAEDALALIAGCPEGAVAKLLHSSGVRLVDEAGEESWVYTRRVGLDEADALRESLPLCPMIFQERVPKAREYRVTAIGRRLFSAAVEIGDPGCDDWRAERGMASAFQARPLPAPVEAAVQRLLDRLGLQYATLDLVQRPDGGVVFLEVNTVSYYDFIEDATGFPITDALADLLLGRGEWRGADP